MRDGVIHRRKWLSMLMLYALLATTARPESMLYVKVKEIWDEPATGPWVGMPIRLLSDMPIPSDPPPVNEYGSRLDRRVEGTGFFRTQEIDGFWWLIDPEGYLHLSAGVCHVAPAESPRAPLTRMEKRFGTMERWAEQTLTWLRQYGFNGLGAWSRVDPLRQVDPPMPYTVSMHVMATYAMNYGAWGHYPDRCIFVFDPDFADYAEVYVREQLAPYAGDPFLLGIFSDNELPMERSLLDRFLNLAPEYHGREAAWEWLRERYGPDVGMDALTDEDRDAFRGYVFDTYYRIVSATIRRHAPQHLFLGSRFSGWAKDSPAMFKAAARYVDVVSFNFYYDLGPGAYLARWHDWVNVPVLITEFYTMGEDTGMGNTSGMGWTVPTQSDRGRFYQHFVLEALEAPNTVGWHWYRYKDNDPQDDTGHESNVDGNKGLVTIDFERYDDALQYMQPMNAARYVVRDHFIKTTK